MIQRIQTVYFFIASLAIFALFLFPVVSVFDALGAKKVMVTGVYQSLANQVVQTENFLLLSIATVILGLIPLGLIFLFKNRKKQEMLSYVGVLIFIGYSYWLTQTIKGVVGSNLKISDYGIGIGLTSVAVLFLVLAAKAINRDEKLVKSADRLR